MLCQKLRAAALLVHRHKAVQEQPGKPCSGKRHDQENQNSHYGNGDAADDNRFYHDGPGAGGAHCFGLCVGVSHPLLFLWGENHKGGWPCGGVRSIEE